MERDTDRSTWHKVDATAFSFIPDHTRKPLVVLDRLESPHLPRAYLAILEDALDLEGVQVNPTGERTPEFKYLVSLMHHIVQWALRSQEQIPTDPPSEAPAELHRLARELNSIEPEEYKSPPGDSCLCWLIRLVARHLRPKTPEDLWDELKKLKIASLLEEKSFSFDSSGLPNHVSISFRTVDPAGAGGDTSRDQQAEEAQTETYYVVATNREHYKDNQLERWADACWRERFVTHAPMLPEVTRRATERLRRPNCQPGMARFEAIEQWKAEAERGEHGAVVFNHLDELIVTFRVPGGFDFCARCAKCRALFAYRVCSECYELEKDLESLTHFFGNTCSEGLLHLLWDPARTEISKGTNGYGGQRE